MCSSKKHHACGEGDFDFPTFFSLFLSHPKAILRSGAVLSFLSMPPFPCFYKCRCWWVQQRRRGKQPAAVTAAVLFNIENVNVEKGITRKEAPFLSLVVLAFMEEGGESDMCRAANKR